MRLNDKITEEKDLEAKKFTAKIESQRVEYESTINSNEDEINKLNNIKLELNADLLAMNTILTRKIDVEEQLRIAREHNT